MRLLKFVITIPDSVGQWMELEIFSNPSWQILLQDRALFSTLRSGTSSHIGSEAVLKFFGNVFAQLLVTQLMVVEQVKPTLIPKCTAPGAM
jgi:hypothetical protein